MKLHIKKGDTVTVIAGDDKGKTGRVLKVYPEDQRALIEGVTSLQSTASLLLKIPAEASIKLKLPYIFQI